jgi:hypothetical protein
MEQNYKNHRQLSVGYYGLTLLPTLVLLIGAVRNLLQAAPSDRYNASLIVLVAVILVSIIFNARGLALKTQDRAIRAEESLRYFQLMGRPIDTRLRLGQIIALRFASDAEYPALSDRAIAENMTPDAIKRAITNWKADNRRV